MQHFKAFPYKLLIPECSHFFPSDSSLEKASPHGSNGTVVTANSARRKANQSYHDCDKYMSSEQILALTSNPLDNPEKIAK
jgi:hypothetical protein